MIERLAITDRETWLTWRRQDITASTVGALFDCHPYCTALRLYVEKRGVEFPSEETGIMRRGRWLEPAVAKAVSEEREGWRLTAPNMYVRDPELRFGATPDFLIEDDPRGVGVLQAKTASPDVYRDQWLNGDQPPMWITLQCLSEMMLTDAAFGAIAVLVVDPWNMHCKIFDVPRSPPAEAKIITAVRGFWSRVADGLEPEPDYGRDKDVIKLLYPHEVKDRTVDLSGDNYVTELLSERHSNKATITALTERCETIENEIRWKLGDAAKAEGLDGWGISYKTEHRSAYTVPAKDVRVLRITRRKVKEAAVND